MNEIIKSIEDAQLKAEAPEFHVGDTVKVYGKIKEGNRERIQIFEGIVLKRQGGGARETFTVRKNLMIQTRLLKLKASNRQLQSLYFSALRRPHLPQIHSFQRLPSRKLQEF